MTSGRPWGDHDERRLILDHIPGCDGSPSYGGGTDQRPFCADGCISFNDGEFHLPVGKLAEFASTLYEAAGLPAPVILDRPGVTFEDGVSRAGRIEVGRLGGRVTVGLYGIEPEEIGPAVARRLAALIAVCAGEAESEPDPAEVGELARVLRGCTPGMAVPTDGDYGLAVARGYAEAALRWFRGKQQREGGM